MQFSHSETISVLIPVRNGAFVLPACLASLAVQTIIPKEIILVDNGSTDATAQVIKEFQKTYTNVLYVFEPRRSRGAARNAGVKKVTGDIIVMTDADCIVPPDWIERLTAPIVTEKEVATIGSQYDFISNYWSSNIQKMYDFLNHSNLTHDGYSLFLDTKNFALRTDLMRFLMFDSYFVALEDTELMHRLRQYVKVLFIPDSKVGHKHQQTLRGVVSTAYIRGYWFIQLYHKYKGVIDRNGVLIFPKHSFLQFLSVTLRINVQSIRMQGWSHLPFYIVHESAWKLGCLVSYFNTKHFK